MTKGDLGGSIGKGVSGRFGCESTAKVSFRTAWILT